MTLRDLLWVWGMKVNALQATADYAAFPFAESKTNTEETIQRTGITNVYIAGGLPITEKTLDEIPSAKRLVCKTSAHLYENGKNVPGINNAIDVLENAKRLALYDRRIDSFALDDFSTGSLSSGVSESDMERFCFSNQQNFPSLPLHGTIYPMSLQDKRLPPYLRFFDQLVLPIWFVDEVGKTYEYIDQLNLISGHKPILFCLYVYDFGAHKIATRADMKKQLDIAEALLHNRKITGCILLGTCLFDIGLEAAEYMFDWIRAVGDDRIGV
jgi:hypothetical protein